MKRIRILNIAGQIMFDGQIEIFPCKIGRELDNQIVLPHASVSRYHAIIEEKDGRTVLTDLKSSNGTWKDGQQVFEVDLAKPISFQIGQLTADWQIDLPESFQVLNGTEPDEPQDEVPDISVNTPPKVKIETGDFEFVPPQAMQKEETGSLSNFTQVEPPPKRLSKIRQPQGELGGLYPWLTERAHRIWSTLFFVFSVNFSVVGLTKMLDGDPRFAIFTAGVFSIALTFISLLLPIPFMLFSKIHCDEYRFKPMFVVSLGLSMLNCLLIIAFPVIRYNFLSERLGSLLGATLWGFVGFYFVWAVGSILFTRAVQNRILVVAFLAGLALPIVGAVEFHRSSDGPSGFKWAGTIEPLLRQPSAESTPVSALLDDMDKSFDRVDRLRSREKAK